MKVQKKSIIISALLPILLPLRICTSMKFLRQLGLYLRMMDVLKKMSKVYSDGFIWNGCRSLDINMLNCQILKCIRFVTISHRMDIPKYGLQSKRRTDKRCII